MQECDKIRETVLPWLTGKTVLDIGCGSQKVVPWAVGVDDASEWGHKINPDLCAKVNRDLEVALQHARLQLHYDVVFSSHTLEHMPEPINAILNYWQTFVRPGGRLILYLPDERFYRYQAGTPVARNPNHHHYLTMDTFLWHCAQVTGLRLEEAFLHVGLDMYSFCVVLLKEPSEEAWQQYIRIPTKEDSDLFSSAVVGLADIKGILGTGLDKRGQEIPSGVGPYNVPFFRKMAALDPEFIVEIGTSCGYSSALWLALTKAKVISIDISDRDETLQAARVLSERHPGRFNFICCDSSKALVKIPRVYRDFMFIDGGHLEKDVLADIQLARDLGIRNVSFDDWLPEYGPGVQSAIAKEGVQLRGVWRNQAWGTL